MSANAAVLPFVRPRVHEDGSRSVLGISAPVCLHSGRARLISVSGTCVVYDALHADIERRVSVINEPGMHRLDWPLERGLYVVPGENGLCSVFWR